MKRHNGSPWRTWKDANKTELSVNFWNSSSGWTSWHTTHLKHASIRTMLILVCSSVPLCLCLALSVTNIRLTTYLTFPKMARTEQLLNCKCRHTVSELYLSHGRNMWLTRNNFSFPTQITDCFYWTGCIPASDWPMATWHNNTCYGPLAHIMGPERQNLVCRRIRWIFTVWANNTSLLSTQH